MADRHEVHALAQVSCTDADILFDYSNQQGANMKKVQHILLAIVAAIFFAPVAQAQTSTIGIGLKASTLGAGLELVGHVSPHFNVRGVANGLNISRNTTQSNVAYDGKLNLFTAGVIVDYLPFTHSGFRLSLGGLYDNNKLSLIGTPTGGNYVINNNTYTAAQVGSLYSSVTFNKFAPYVGIGYGNAVADTGLSFSFDLGVLYQGSPKATLAATGSAAGLAADVQAEQAQLQSDLKNYKLWPVLGLGLDYSFN